MASEARLRQQAFETLTRELLELTKHAEEARPRETAACVRIQSCCRGFVVRKALRRADRAARVIQRWWRGFTGRCRAHQQALSVAARLRQQFFDTAATRIQRHWRGVFSRKHRHDFYRRKAFLQDVLLRTVALRSEIAAAAAASAEAAAAEAAEAEQRQFEESLAGQHHLLSTRRQAGVFRAPYWRHGGAGDAIEGRLRAAETRGWAGATGEAVAAGAAPPPPPRRSPQPRYRASIRATEPLNAEAELAAVDHAVGKLLLARAPAATLSPFLRSRAREPLTLRLRRRRAAAQRGGRDFETSARLVLPPDPISLAAALPFEPAVRHVSPDKSIPRAWTGPKPSFKLATVAGLPFDAYDPNMAERPPNV